MIRNVTRWCLLGVIVCAVGASDASAQWAVAPGLLPNSAVVAAQLASSLGGELNGSVRDDHGQPLAGAVVSALGSTTAFAVSDREGRFVFRNLPAGPYLVRAHLQGYVPARGRIISVSAGAQNIPTIALTRSGGEPSPEVLAAGVGGADPASTAPETPAEHDHNELAWRLRHLKRSVLKDDEIGLPGLDEDEGSLLENSLSSLGRAVGTPARLASALFADIPLNAQINLLTSTSFDRPQDLFSVNAPLPRGVAYLALAAPTANGEWAMRGTMTQGDLSSWIVAGSYTRQIAATHRYQAGMSYGMQRYLGGNADALAAMRDGSRNVGAVYAYDNYRLTPQVHITYGGKYARYDYLTDRGLLSPRAGIEVQPFSSDSFKVRASFAHTETAPGAEEFMPPSGGLWLPPERTFSTISRGGFVPERVDHMELAVEREWPGVMLVGLRTFRQSVEDQVITMFGAAMATVPSAAGIGHYFVGSAGDLEARGWGMSVSRVVASGVSASLDYTQVDARWLRASPDSDAFALVAASALRSDERVHDLTASIQSVLTATATRVRVVYKLNNAFAASDPLAESGAGGRFDLQVNQALPFLNFTSGQWEMLIAVKSLFHDELLDGSVYDELLVVRPPKRVLGGVTVRF